MNKSQKFEILKERFRNEKQNYILQDAPYGLERPCKIAVNKNGGRLKQRPGMQYRGLKTEKQRVAFAVKTDRTLEEMELFECVRHKCDQGNCIEFSHLDKGTSRQNAEDRNDRKRTSTGERHYKSKLTEQDVSRIRYLSWFGRSASDIADQFGVTGGCIRSILNGANWPGAPGPVRAKAACSNPKLSPVDVRAIRICAELGFHEIFLAELFNVKQPTINLVINRKTHSAIP